jgi:hypothetical protein
MTLAGIGDQKVAEHGQISGLRQPMADSGSPSRRGIELDEAA